MTTHPRVPAIVCRAERYMADNADTPLTITAVAARLGLSLRSLQAGFRRWRNTTPKAHLRHVRLTRVRDDLLSPEPAADVTTIAMRHGFMHLGRFSAHYRSVFGEAPSTTLRRARAGSGPAGAPPPLGQATVAGDRRVASRR